MDFTDFEAGKVFLLECGQHENYLWIGGRVSFKHQKVIKEHIKKLHPNYEYVHEKMEPLLFKNKFSHVKEAFDKPSPASQHSSPAHSAAALPGVGPEVARMVDENFGTLKMVSGSRGQLGDCLRQGHDTTIINRFFHVKRFFG